MTEVLQMPAASRTDLLHQSTTLRRSCSSSPSLLLLDTSTKSSTPLPQLYSHTAEVHSEQASTLTSRSSSTTSFDSYNPKPISQPSASPSKGHVFAFTDQIESPDDINFPDYEGSHYSYQNSSQSYSNDNEEPEISTTTDTTRSDSPLPTPTTVDDTAIRLEPSRHVDYLNHNWREEDIWASWRHIISRRKVYGQSSRLENASWRTWAKSKYRLRTIPPESLNWLKESDVTWLYGPLQPAESHPITSDTSEPVSRLSKTGSFMSKKPILKKRSVSEIMLQKSLSTSSLVAQAAASVQAQQYKHAARLRVSRTNSDFVFGSSNELTQQTSCEQIDYFSSKSTSTAGSTPSDSHREKHIRFDDTVEQCIAVDCKYGDSYEFDAETEDDTLKPDLSDSSSDECLMIKSSTVKRPSFSRDTSTKDKPARSGSFNTKMIETIESTTLKYRTESPDITSEQPQHHVFGGGKKWSNNRLSPSPSVETLRPSRPSRNFLLADDDEDDYDSDTDSAWSFGASNPKSSLGASAGPSDEKGRRKQKWNPPETYDGVEGMRRTNSGMLMPYDEDEDDIVATGLFGKITETINTAKDIGHVLWNVGWGK